MIKFATNIYEIVDIIYRPTRFFGLAPYKKEIISGNRIRFVEAPIGLNHLLLNGGLALWVSAFACLRIFYELKYHTISLIDGIDGAMYIFLQLATISVLLLVVIKQKYFISTLEMITKADETFKKIGIDISYNIVHLMALAFFWIVYPVYLFALVAPLWDIAYEIQYEVGFTLKLQKIVSQFLNLAPNFLMRFIPLYFFSAFLVVCVQMLQKLNQYIIKVEASTSRSDEQFMREVLTTIKVLHTLIYEIITLTVLAFSLPVFFHISLTFLEITCAVVVLQYSEHVGSFQIIFGSIFFGLSLFIILIPCQKVLNEAKRTRRLISELSLPYFNFDLSLQRKMLLFQLLHEEIDINASGFYNLNMEVITSHVGTISMLMMFFLQLRDQL